MTDDLIDFLRARLDEDEQAARDAARRVSERILPEDPSLLPPEHVADVRERAMRWQSTGFLFGRRVTSDLGMDRVEVSDSFTEISEHIARHDPAQVLREVEANGRIIDALEQVAAEQLHHDAGGYCFDCGVNPEQLLKLLALPYADHPDFRPDWGV